VVGGHRYILPRWSIGDGIGSYVVSNHFAAAIYLTLPILIGLCRRRLQGPVWSWGGSTLAIVMFAAGIWTLWDGAHSRAGAAATLVAAVVFMAIASAEGPARLVWGSVCALTLTAMTILTAVFYGIAPGVVGLLPDGLATPVSAALRDGRVGLTHAAIVQFFRSPLFGTGLGTYGFVSGSGNANMKWTFYAHNDYAQLLAEAGLVGGALLLVLVGVLALALVRTWRAPEGERLAVAGVWAGLVALGLHSFFDWNMHVPANALLACLLAGIALSTAATFPTGCVVPRSEASLSSGTMTAVAWSNRRGVAAVILTGACVLASVLAVRDTKTELAARRLRHALMSIRTAKNPDATTLAIGRLKWGIVVARTAARRHPTDREIALLAGQAALHLAAEDESLEGEDAGTWFRRARLCNPLTWGLADPPVEPQE
jgi:hypothetical protein